MMLPLIPLLVNLAGEFGPTLMEMLVGPKGEAVTKTAISVARQVFGTADLASIEATVKDNPEMAQVFIEQLKAQTEQYKASLEDVSSARTQTIELARVSSAIAWGAPVVSVVIVIGFISLLSLWLFKPPSSDVAVLAVLNIMIGTLSTAFGAVVQYWLGSSAGSANKDSILNNALLTAQGNVTKSKK